NIASWISSLHQRGIYGSIPSQQSWSQCHSYAFDVSVWEIFAALLGGGRLVVIPEHVMESLHELGQWLDDAEVNIVYLTAPLL
ncbi:hypothetical protein, partial [Mycobacterium marinum]|uniref:hypothetical protein n=1 Tax=Mycobacterium marinum TaxID=1781 RepID=UPI0021C4C025